MSAVRQTHDKKNGAQRHQLRQGVLELLRLSPMQRHKGNGIKNKSRHVIRHASIYLSSACMSLTLLWRILFKKVFEKVNTFPPRLYIFVRRRYIFFCFNSIGVVFYFFFQSPNTIFSTSSRICWYSFVSFDLHER